MSGLLSPSAVHDRTRAALAEWARREGRSYDQLASILGIGHASAWRRCSEGGEWGLLDLVRAICHAERIDGDRRILDGLIADVRGGSAGQAIDCLPAARDAMAAMAREVAALVERTSDGRLDRTEAQATRREITIIVATLSRLDADLQEIAP